MSTPAFTDIARGDVIAFAPKLAKLDGGAWLDLLAYANGIPSSTFCESPDGASTRLARILLAAHLAQSLLLARDGASGPVTSESAGALRRSYGFLNTDASRMALAGTIFGQQLLGLLQSSCLGSWMLL
jgi:hypothetical protein